MKKKRPDIDATDLKILATLKSNPEMWSQVKRLAALSLDEVPDCIRADDAEDAIDKAGQALKFESLRGWAQSSSGHAEHSRASEGSGKRSKKNS